MHAAVIATLPDTGSRAYTLTVGGAGDVNVGGQSPAAHRVPIDSIEVEEEGPGGVSGMDFAIWDPNREVVLAEGAWVEFWDVANALPYFTGFVQSWSMSGIVGRTVDVHCIGIETVLDWMVVPSLTIPSGTDIDTAVQSIIANATGIGVSLRAFADGTKDGSQTGPIGFLGAVTAAELGADVVLAGETVREAIRMAIDNSVSGLLFGTGSVGGKFTVDFWRGLRLYSFDNKPGDYVNLTVTDVVGGGTGATVLDHETDAAGVPHAVFVTGGNAAGTGLVSDGSGIPGPVASINDDTILTAAARNQAGRAYLQDKAVATRGTLQVENLAPTTNIRAGSRVTITNSAADLDADAFAIASISKRFIAAKQTWTVAYGGFRPSAVRLSRRLTRGTRS